jgi:hypothetical protein
MTDNGIFIDFLGKMANFKLEFSSFTLVVDFTHKIFIISISSNQIKYNLVPLDFCRIPTRHSTKPAVPNRGRQVER